MEKESETLINGWAIRSKQRMYHGADVYAVNVQYGTEIRIDNKLLPVFGYMAHGCEVGIDGSHRVDNIEEQKVVLAEIIAKELDNMEHKVGYHTIRDYLKREYKGKIVLGKSKGVSKIDAAAIKRVLAIMDEEYQYLWRFQKAEVQENRIFKEKK